MYCGYAKFFAMNKIPTHKVTKEFPTGIMLRYVSDSEQMPAVDYAHRDDYFIFLLGERGKGKMLIDFKEYEMTGNQALYILPGQVHFPLGYVSASGWILAVDAMLVKDEYKAVFEKASLMDSQAILNEETMNDLKQCISVLQRRLASEGQPMEQHILHALTSAYIGMIAEVYQKGLPVSMSKRPAMITFQFKSLLSARYKTLKSPSQYASEMNLSPVYLNEAVKQTTGLTVGDCIRKEIVVQAKRLLFYTKLSVKEIALELGYEDWAYFTRLFTKTATLPPTAFRVKYLK
jgi:AraC-like DNA-binding protein/mannose-6-phosphate isomerase-like protein (cupin superfamily)